MCGALNYINCSNSGQTSRAVVGSKIQTCCYIMADPSSHNMLLALIGLSNHFSLYHYHPF